MKYFILTLIFTFSFTANAAWYFPVGKAGAEKWYKSKAQCESSEGQSCYDITGKDVRRWKVGFLQPEILRTADCDDATDCQAKLDADPSEFSCLEGTPVYDDKANWPGLDFSPRPATGWFLWCQIEGLVPDPAGIAAADTEDAAIAAERANRAAARAAREVALDDCVQVTKSGTLTLPEASACIRALVRELRGQAVPVDDL